MTGHLSPVSMILTRRGPIIPILQPATRRPVKGTLLLGSQSQEGVLGLEPLWRQLPNLWGLQGSSPILILFCPSPPTYLPPPQEPNGSNSQATRLSTGDGCAPRSTSRNAWRHSWLLQLGKVRGEERGEVPPLGLVWRSGMLPNSLHAQDGPHHRDASGHARHSAAVAEKTGPEQRGSPSQTPAGGFLPVFARWGR